MKKFMKIDTIEKTFSKTLFGVTGLAVALMMAFGGAVAANADDSTTTADLQAQIASLLQTIQSLQSQLAALQGGKTTGSVSGSVNYTFTTDLHTGSTGIGVLKLQQALNADPDTRVAATGAGSPGMESQYYGSLTANAVSRFQEKYASEILFPLGLTKGTGYFGASTRAKMNALLAAGATGTSTGTSTGNGTGT
ncbi:MAG TPA: hypothetical protein VFM02_00730, partial [Candidatus Paceibacterota bacterium]|nr:hypothetical protein [Candidatus Paceibacterota bacterium]